MLGRSQLASEVNVVLGRQTAKENSDECEEEDADAGSCELGVAVDVPRRGDETGVDRVPVPQHLAKC